MPAWLTWETLIACAMLGLALVALVWLFLVAIRADAAEANARRRRDRDPTLGQDQYRPEQAARVRLLQKDRAVWDAVHQAPGAGEETPRGER
jgi:hypothetical protein